MLVSPKQPITKTIAQVSLENDRIEVRFPEKLGVFNELVKSHGFRWSWPIWYRDVTRLALSAKERCVELCYNLIDAGFIVDCPDSLVQDIVNANFEPEQKLWIKRRTSGKHKNWFVICWPYGDDFYKEARRLTGSEYSKPFVVVPKEHYADVLDFANIHGFKLTDAALQLVELAKQQEDNILVVDLKQREKPKSKQDGGGGIPRELLDI